LETIEKRLSGIEGKLEKVIRLEERVTNHEQSIVRFDKRLNSGDERMMRLELWQADQNPDMILTALKGNTDNIELVKIEVDALTSASNINIGRSDITKTILKWVAGILASIIIYQATRGM
jgi:muramoyltetrapeptide carboxypeptidase LdcA involved in peptidoglycan recycling